MCCFEWKHQGRDKMEAILQTISSYVLFWMEKVFKKSQHWISVSRSEVNTSRLRQKGSYVTNDILICAVWNSGPRQKGSYVTNDILICAVLNENIKAGQNGSYVTNDFLICAVLNGYSLQIYNQISLLCFLKIQLEKVNTGPNTTWRSSDHQAITWTDDDPFSEVYKRYLASAVCWRRGRITHLETVWTHPAIVVRLVHDYHAMIVWPSCVVWI